MLLRLLRLPYFYFTAIIIAGFFILRPEVNKFILQDTDQIPEPANDKQYIFAYDFNHDGTSEYVKYKTGVLGQPAVVVYDYKREPLGQWDFQGEFANYWRFYAFGDYDINGSSEAYLLTLYNDTIFANFFEPFGSGEKYSIPVTPVSERTGIDDLWISLNKMTDFNKDGIMEAVVSVTAGYSLDPRGLFLLDLTNGTSQFFSHNYSTLSALSIMDIDGDKRDELFLLSGSRGNVDGKTREERSDSWVSGLFIDPGSDPGLKHLMSIYGPHSQFMTFPFVTGNDTLIGGLANMAVQRDPVLYLWDRDLNLIDSVSLHLPRYPEGWQFRGNFTDEKLRPVFSSPHGMTYGISDQGGFKYLGDIGKNSRIRACFDLDDDGQNEYITMNGETELIVFSRNFRHSAKLRIPRVDESLKQLRFSKFYFNGIPHLMVQNGHLTECYLFRPNWLFWGQYLFLALVIAFVFFIIFLANLQQKKQLQKRQKDKDEVTRLQFQAIANQINPHFSYNILNTIGYSVLNEDREKAYKLLVKYSQLTRNLIEGGIQPNRTLRQEMGFVENFLDLQKSRFEKEFKYYIDIDPSVNQEILVPRMIVLTFVENAIKHGLSLKEGEKLLKIQVFRKNGRITIIVEDNGNGRKASANHEYESAGQGLGILDRIIDIHRKIHKKPISYTIEDIEGPGHSGTRVIINLE
jgi:hypothetical protein